MNKFIGLVVIILGVMAAAYFYDAGSQLEAIGNNLTMLRSQGGQTVAEAYYQDIGRYGVATKSFMYALSLVSLSLSLGLGTMIFQKNFNQTTYDKVVK